MRVTSKGQVTIPKLVRDRLGIQLGSEVEFVVRDGEAVLRARTDEEDSNARAAKDLRDHIERVRGTMDLGGMSPDEFIAWLRD
jgi:AbrB family looped-hinge helix DNA binding protein